MKLTPVHMSAMITTGMARAASPSHVGSGRPSRLSP